VTQQEHLGGLAALAGTSVGFGRCYIGAALCLSSSGQLHLAVSVQSPTFARVDRTRRKTSEGPYSPRIV
jgi:hypothetical protein